MTIRRHRSLAALFLVLALVSAGCVRTAEGPREEQRNPFFLTGKERVQAMDYQGAAEAFERALQDDPRSVLTHFELGVLYETHLADYPAALYHYNKVLKIRPNGYPADTIRYRIPACRQELVKADSLAVLNPSALREMEKLREENQELRRQIGELKSAATRTPSGPTPVAPSPGNVGGPGTSPLVPVGGPSAGRLSTSNVSGANWGGTSSPPGARSTETPAGMRSHTLRPKETIASLSRQYNVRIPAILSANRGLDPKRLKVGQTVLIPAASTSSSSPPPASPAARPR